MTSTRPYTMTARADSAAETAGRIVRALIELVTERVSLEVTLDEVAGRAGVSVQTVLRHFGSRDALLERAMAVGAAEVAEERSFPAGNLEDALGVLLQHYERRGDFVLGMLAHEQRDERIRRVMAPGRVYHRDWVADLFGPALRTRADADTGFDADETIDLLVVATDVYAWKLLRRDRGLSVGDVHRRMLRLTTAILT
ncbi:MAG: regulatory protein TetR [Naasia sp.]|jgi:AcrR family transcriptional regulator|uniref:TetR/AcrR family transcriptional regulator n=1 Tax=Naasia sp. TaxID=2546198 RepID=UPI00261D435B|nr:TetR/AcrR family transcriptional regulator [Naasia sp.]MCU1571291.1 regulatory protein TetR [Naasia sp.]